MVPVRDGELKIIGPKGEVSFVQLQLGKSRFRNAGVEHNVINNGSSEMVFIEIELKDTSSAGSNMSQLVGADDCHPVPASVRTVHIDDRGGYQ